MNKVVDILKRYGLVVTNITAIFLLSKGLFGFISRTEADSDKLKNVIEKLDSIEERISKVSESVVSLGESIESNRNVYESFRRSYTNYLLNDERLTKDEFYRYMEGIPLEKKIIKDTLELKIRVTKKDHVK